MTIKLRQLPINYLQSFGFEANASIFWIKAPVPERIIKVSFKKILNINLSRDILDPDCDDLQIMDISHEFRKITVNDLKDYNFIVQEIDQLPKLHLVTLHGGTIFTIICQELEMEEV